MKRRLAWSMLIGSTVGMVVNIFIFLMGWLTTRQLLLINLTLSYFALIFAAVDALLIEHKEDE